MEVGEGRKRSSSEENGGRGSHSPSVLKGETAGLRVLCFGNLASDVRDSPQPCPVPFLTPGPCVPPLGSAHPTASLPSGAASALARQFCQAGLLGHLGPEELPAVHSRSAHLRENFFATCNVHSASLSYHDCVYILTHQPHNRILDDGNCAFHFGFLVTATTAHTVDICSIYY